MNKTQDENVRVHPCCGGTYLHTADCKQYWPGGLKRTATDDEIGDECICGPYDTAHCPLCIELHRLRIIEKRALEVRREEGLSSDKGAAANYILRGTWPL